jgi:hypothetical protein
VKKLFLLIMLLMMILLPYSLKAQFQTIQPGGTEDSIGVDTDGDDAVDYYIFPAQIKKGTNITLSVSGDVMTIAGDAGSGTADTLWLVNTAHDDSIAFVGASVFLVPTTDGGVTITISNDTAFIAATLGNTVDLTSEVTGELPDGNVADAITVTGYMQDADINTFTELQAWVSDKTLVNEEDIFTIDANWINTANPWADNEVASSGIWNAAHSRVAADSANWTDAYGWGNHASAGYTDIGQTVEGNELGTGLKDSITNGQTAYGYGDHGAQNYLDDDVAGDVDTTDIDDTEFKEYVEDRSGAMFTGNTETRIQVTYNEDGTVDFLVDDMNDDVPESGDLGIIDTEAEFESELFALVVPTELEGAIEDSLDVYIDSAAFHDSLDIVRNEIRDTIAVITDIDSANVTDGGLSEDDINWSVQYFYLTDVHGQNQASADSTYLSFPVFSATQSWLFTDSAGDIQTANLDDTAVVSGAVPIDCTCDSLTFMYQVDDANGATGLTKIDSIKLMAPDLDAFTNLTDSAWYVSTTGWNSETWTQVHLSLGSETVGAGYRFGLYVYMNFNDDNDVVRLGWARLRCTK